MRLRAVEHGLFQLIAVGTPPGEDGSADLRYVLAVARTIGAHLNRYSIVITKSTVPVGTADKVRAELTAYARRARCEGRVRRGVQSRVPQGGRGDRRLHEARPGGHRHRQPAHHRAHARALRALHAQPRPPHRHGHPLLGAHQVRGQRDARDQDQLHERAGQHRRARRRRHREGAHRHRLGSAHRLQLHLPGHRLRRLVLSRRTCRHSSARPTRSATSRRS